MHTRADTHMFGSKTFFVVHTDITAACTRAIESDTWKEGDMDKTHPPKRSYTNAEVLLFVLTILLSSFVG